MKRQIRLIVALIGALQMATIASNAQQAQSEQAVPAPEWRLTTPLGDDEKGRVLSLAAALKIDRPGVIQSEEIFQPLTCDALRIESVPTTDGNRRAWKRVWVTYTSWPNGCDRMKAQRSPPDTWVAADAVTDVGAWRVNVAGSDIDVETPSNIPYSEVSAIVEAVRTGRFVDRMPVNTRVPLRPVPKVDYRSIVVIWQDVVDQSRYAVRFRGTNVVFCVVVRGGQVQLLEWRREYA